jgi:hypothetical protein
MPHSPSEASAARPGLRARLTSPTGLAVAALAGITLAFYHGLWLPGLVLIKRDAFRFHLPIKQHLIERFSSGELPQWFPYEALGRPFIGTAHTGVFHPFTALYFLLPVTDAYRASTLLSCLLAAAGAFTLGRVLNLSRAGALVAGLAFALSGYVASLADNLVYLYSICALPFFCAALEKALGRNPAWIVAPGAIWATVLLNGDAQTGYYYGLIALLWAAMRAPGSRLNAVLRLTLAAGLTALLAGIQLGPSWVVFAGSERAQPALFHEQALIWSTHPLRLATIFASPVDGNAGPADLGRFFFGVPPIEGGLSGLWAESLYLGIPVTGLALLGAWHRHDLCVMAVLGGLALALSLGRLGGLYELFSHLVPLWSVFRYPEKFMGVVSFAVAMLAGAGLDAMRRGNSPITPWLVAVALCGGAWLGLRTEAAGAWTAAHFAAPPVLARAVTGSAALAFFFSAIAALGMWLVALGARRGRLHMRALLMVPAAIIALDLGRANMGAYHTGPAEAASFTPPLVEALAMREGALRPGRFRLVSLRSQTFIPTPIFNLLGYDAEAVASRQALDVAHNTPFHIESADHYLPGLNPAFASMIERKIGIEAAARYNVTYYVSRRFLLKEPGFAGALVAELPEYDLALFTNPIPAKPRAYLSRHPERAASPVDPMVLLARAEFLDGEVDVIETSDLTLPGPATNGSALIERYDPEDVRVRVETPQPAVLILLDAYEQGWTATLDGGAELPLLRANALVRAVVVPAGRHVVAFSYQTPLLKAGAWASLTGVLLCLGLIAHARGRTRRPGDHA